MKQQYVVKKADGMAALEQICAQVLSSPELPLQCLVRRRVASESASTPTFSIALSSGAELGVSIQRPLTRMERCEMIVKAARNIARLAQSDARWIALPRSDRSKDLEAYEVVTYDSSVGLNSMVAQISPLALVGLESTSTIDQSLRRPIPIALTLTLFMREHFAEAAGSSCFSEERRRENGEASSNSAPQSETASRRARKRGMLVTSQFEAFAQRWRQGNLIVAGSQWCLGVTDQWGKTFQAEFTNEDRTGVRMAEERALKAEFPVQIELGTLSLASETLLELRPGDEISIPEAIPMLGTLRVGQTPWARVRIEQRGSEIVLAVEELLGLEETFSENSRLTP